MNDLNELVNGALVVGVVSTALLVLLLVVGLITIARAKEPRGGSDPREPRK